MYGILDLRYLVQHKKTFDFISSTSSPTPKQDFPCPVAFDHNARGVFPEFDLKLLEQIPQFLPAYIPLVDPTKHWFTSKFSSDQLIALSQLGSPNSFQCFSADRIPSSAERLLMCNISPMIIHNVNSGNIEKAKKFLEIARQYPRPIIFGTRSEYITLGLNEIEGECPFTAEQLVQMPLRQYGAFWMRNLVRHKYSEWLSK